MKVAFITGTRGKGGCYQLDKYLAKALGTKPISPFFDSPDEFIKVRTSFLSRVLSKLSIPPLHIFDWYVFSSMDIPDCDILVTSGNWPRAVITPEETLHVNYCHSPWRNLYDLYHYKLSKSLYRSIYELSYEFLRLIDTCIDKRVDHYFSNSPITQKRLKKYLKRESVILYPPVECKKYKFEEYGDFYLYIGRLEPEKRVEEVIRACILTRKHLIVAGTGSLYKVLRQKYGRIVDFLGYISERDKIKLLSRCKAVIYPTAGESFGITVIEALASGKPVIVSNDGFPAMLVKNTGFGYICDGSIEGIERALKVIDKEKYEPDKIISYVRKHFDFDVFKKKLWFWLRKWKEGDV